jgi:hypothetical protein
MNSEEGSSMYPLPAPGVDGALTDTGSPPLHSPRAQPQSGTLQVLVTGVPIPGHVIPLLPLARAITAAGDQVTFAVPPSMAQFTGGLPVLPTGPDIGVLLAENDRRTGGADLADLRDIRPLAQFFAATPAGCVPTSSSPTSTTPSDRCWPPPWGCR